MKARSKWPDFLVTLAIRFAGGALLGALACVVAGHRAILRTLSHDDVRTPVLLLILVAGIGGIIGIATVPHWQTPWYKGVRDKKDGH